MGAFNVDFLFQSLVMKDTLKKMMRVLRRLGHINNDKVIQLKVRGRWR